MKKEEIIDWMDKQVDINRSLIDGRVLGEDIKAAYVPNGIHIYSGIEKCAEAARVPYMTEFIEGAKFPIRKSFVYRGTIFIQLSGEGCSP